MHRSRLQALSLILTVIGIILVIFATLSPLATASSVNPDANQPDAINGGARPAQQVTPTAPRGSPGATVTPTPTPGDPDKVPTPIFFAGMAVAFAAGVAVGYYLGTRSRGNGPIDRGPQRRG